MDNPTLAQLICQIARHDITWGKGRIIITEARQDLCEPDLTAEQIIAALKETYPQYKVEQRTDNILLIEFEETPRSGPHTHQ